ncbi:arginine decarboxylase, pyruvoyl-dependent [Biomaibacter acetigenes]|jgi:arginine decarboxylase|uniref:Pyruvoyl-dependent arginine decarboxylase AaxB n=1 Tax=Biomaibacter acetigenes TaxID=2316383 RepID=A0A3G2R788_9FIRM|nr:arginine decarboxylase, pyruvoyl-dependent [Biomaibacter acetigenes]AYO31235.1 arginine decarboxylase, pyruvoyl-dependent [Biomaibacter acetigenes]MDN5301066.1 arginine decarboxylase [Thermoanaerobacteraceae bacterium]
MLPMPTKYRMVAGSSEGATELNAFDGALLSAGAGNLNLLRVSSILPPGAVYDETLVIPPGNLVPVAYGSIVNSRPGATISAAVAVGIPEDGDYGVIMELSGEFDRFTAESRIRQMVVNAFKIRNKPLADVRICSAEHMVDKIGCAFAGVLLWY